VSGALGTCLGVAGAWLLFAGPVYQAGLDLEAESTEVDRIRARLTTQGPTSRISRWWWLFPPMRIILITRRRKSLLAASRTALDANESRVLRGYVRAAQGWLLVGLGAWLLMVREVLTAAEASDWPSLATWAALAAATVCGLAAGS
jgi:hypothetical protein